MPHVPRPRFLPWLNFGQLLTMGTILVSVTGVVVRLEMQQDNFVEALETQSTKFEQALSAQAELTKARVDVIKVELESKISANEARYQSLDRILGSEIRHIREALDAIRQQMERESDRLDRFNAKPKG